MHRTQLQSYNHVIQKLWEDIDFEKMTWQPYEIGNSAKLVTLAIFNVTSWQNFIDIVQKLWEIEMK